MHFLNRGALVLTPIKIDRTVRKRVFTKILPNCQKKFYLHRYYINRLWKENPFEHLFPRCALTLPAPCVVWV